MRTPTGVGWMQSSRDGPRDEPRVRDVARVGGQGGGRWVVASSPRMSVLWSEVADSGVGEVVELRWLEASLHVAAELVVTVASWMVLRRKVR
jgi:hypothetical protein